jgi:hypothetical protein
MNKYLQDKMQAYVISHWYCVAMGLIWGLQRAKFKRFTVAEPTNTFSSTTGSSLQYLGMHSSTVTLSPALREQMAPMTPFHAS